MFPALPVIIKRVKDSLQQKPRVLLLTTARSYRNEAFLSAADQIGIEIVQGIDLPRNLARSESDILGIDFGSVDEAVNTVRAYHEQRPLQAILPVDDSGAQACRLQS